MTQNSFTFKDVEVSFSTMLNKPEKCKYGKNFMVRIPIDNPVIEEMKKAYKELNEVAKEAYSKQLGKKIKNATSVEDVFAESIYAEGFVELKFNVYFNRETENEDGTKSSELVLNTIYETPNFTYKIDNNGKKEYELDNGRFWQPLSTNKIDIVVSLVAKYDKKNNKPSIQFKAEEVKIIDSQYKGKSSGPKTGYITLGGNSTSTETKVESSKPVEDSELFSAEDLQALDV